MAKVTLKKFLELLVGRAAGVNEDGETQGKPNRALQNFLNTHHLAGTDRGSPLWKRLPSFYTRGRKSYSGGNVPGGARRMMEKRT